MKRAGLLAGAALVAALAAGSARAYETDQFHNRLAPLRDSTVPMNAHVDEAIAAVAREWRGPRDDWKLVNRVYRRLGGLHWVDRIERWAMRAPEVDKLRTARYQSIYAGHPLYATRVTALFGIGVTFKLDGVLVGSDKLGHFFSQGRKFYQRWLVHRDERRAARRSAATERAIFGRFTTGDYSNADLVANYEGHRFHRSLFEDDIVPGKPAILRWERDHWVVQRAFDWADHVNPYWDEALQVNGFDSWLRPHMRKRFATFCADYAKDPAAWTIPPDVDAGLRAKYAMLELEDTRDMRMASICKGLRADG